MSDSRCVLIVGLTTWLALSGSSATAADRSADKRPNVIVILVDDMGYSDLGCQGGDLVPTPHIDSLAKNGVRCTNAYTSGCVCAPTRAGLMTGRYQHRFGLEFNPQPGSDAGENGMPPSEVTLPELMQGAGYATGMVGKWHLGGREGQRPPEQGFQEFFGFLEGAHRFTPDPTFVEGTSLFVPFQAGIRRGLEYVRETEYLTDALGREALSFIDRHAEEPFFLYLPFNAVHSPLDATDSLRARVDGIGPPKRREYAALLVSLDDNVGRVLTKLREKRLTDKTLIFFLSDNGGAPQPYNETNNLPLRGKKGELLEGGIRVPFLAQWEGVIPAGRTVEQPVIQLDILTTAVTAAGGTLPADRTIDGKDILPLLSGRSSAPAHEALFWRYGDPKAVREGNWKLLKTLDEPSQLYDLAADIGETKDLAAKHPDVVQRLEERLAEWEGTLAKPMWSQQQPHPKNIPWLHSVLGDPSNPILPPEPGK